MRDSFLNTFDLFSNHFKLGSDVLADLLCLDFNCFQTSAIKIPFILCNDISQVFGYNHPFVPTYLFSR